MVSLTDLVVVHRLWGREVGVNGGRGRWGVNGGREVGDKWWEGGGG